MADALSGQKVNLLDRPPPREAGAFFKGPVQPRIFSFLGYSWDVTERLNLAYSLSAIEDFLEDRGDESELRQAYQELEKFNQNYKHRIENPNAPQLSAEELSLIRASLSNLRFPHYQQHDSFVYENGQHPQARRALAIFRETFPKIRQFDPKQTLIAINVGSGVGPALAFEKAIGQGPQMKGPSYFSLGLGTYTPIAPSTLLSGELNFAVRRSLATNPPEVSCPVDEFGNVACGDEDPIIQGPPVTEVGASIGLAAPSNLGLQGIKFGIQNFFVQGHNAPFLTIAADDIAVIPVNKKFAIGLQLPPGSFVVRHALPSDKLFGDVSDQEFTDLFHERSLRAGILFMIAPNGFPKSHQGRWSLGQGLVMAGIVGIDQIVNLQRARSSASAMRFASSPYLIGSPMTREEIKNKLSLSATVDWTLMGWTAGDVGHKLGLSLREGHPWDAAVIGLMVLVPMIAYAAQVGDEDASKNLSGIAGAAAGGASLATGAIEVLKGPHPTHGKLGRGLVWASVPVALVTATALEFARIGKGGCASVGTLRCGPGSAGAVLQASSTDEEVAEYIKTDGASRIVAGALGNYIFHTVVNAIQDRRKDPRNNLDSNRLRPSAQFGGNVGRDGFMVNAMVRF